MLKVQYVWTLAEGLWLNTPVNISLGSLLAVLHADPYSWGLI